MTSYLTPGSDDSPMLPIYTLDELKEKFQTFDGYSSHRPLLYEALKNTMGIVIEMGSGEGSTLLLAEYCKILGRTFLSLESNPKWYEKMKALYPPILFIEDWNKLDISFNPIGLLFVDHAPGEQRKYDIAKYRKVADVIVVHDTEQSADYGYKMSTVLNSFKYRKDFKPEGFAHTTAVSDKIDVTKWKISN